MVFFANVSMTLSAVVTSQENAISALLTNREVFIGKIRQEKYQILQYTKT
jgi:predicted phage tail protein